MRFSDDVKARPREVIHADVCRTLSRGKCRDSSGHGSADCESRRLWGARCYSFSACRWDLRLPCRWGKLSREIVLLHDNTRPHTARQTQALLREQFHWNIFEHPPYSPDLAPSEFLLFPEMKEHPARKRFANDDLKNVAAATWYEEVIQKLVPRYDKWLNIKGNYVE